MKKKKKKKKVIEKNLFGLAFSFFPSCPSLLTSPPPPPSLPPLPSPLPPPPPPLPPSSPLPLPLPSNPLPPSSPLLPLPLSPPPLLPPLSLSHLYFLIERLRVKTFKGMWLVGGRRAQHCRGNRDPNSGRRTFLLESLLATLETEKSNLEEGAREE